MLTFLVQIFFRKLESLPFRMILGNCFDKKSFVKDVMTSIDFYADIAFFMSW
jgi:hypothetical protein